MTRVRRAFAEFVEKHGKKVVVEEEEEEEEERGGDGQEIGFSNAKLS